MDLWLAQNQVTWPEGESPSQFCLSSVICLHVVSQLSLNVCRTLLYVSGDSYLIKLKKKFAEGNKNASSLNMILENTKWPVKKKKSRKIKRIILFVRINTNKISWSQSVADWDSVRSLLCQKQRKKNAWQTFGKLLVGKLQVNNFPHMSLTIIHTIFTCIFMHTYSTSYPKGISLFWPITLYFFVNTWNWPIQPTKSPQLNQTCA